MREFDEFVKEAAGYEEGLKTLGKKQSVYGKLNTLGNVVNSTATRAARLGAMAAQTHKQAERTISHPQDLNNFLSYANLSRRLQEATQRAGSSTTRTQRYAQKLQKELPSPF